MKRRISTDTEGEAQGTDSDVGRLDSCGNM